MKNHTLKAGGIIWYVKFNLHRLLKNPPERMWKSFDVIIILLT